MKITMYELLGLVKDDKAPKKVIYQNELLYYDRDLKDYYNEEGMHSLFAGVSIVLYDEVEIIEEKLENRARFQYSEIPVWLEHSDMIKVINENFAKHQKAIYEILDYLDSLKDKGDLVYLKSKEDE